MELISISDKDMQEAVQALDEEIGELTRLKEILQRSEFGTDMSEETYHSMCETELRYTDALGKALGERLGYVYIKRTPNYFYYEMPNGWELRVPSSRCCGAEIVVPRYFHKDITVEREWYSKEGRLRELRSRKEQIEADVIEGDVISKSRIVFWHRYRHNTLGKAVMLLKYILGNPFNHYEKRFREYYEEISKQERELSDALSCTVKELQSGRKTQEIVLDACCQRLLQWTEKVRVYQKENQSPSEEITREEFFKKV